MEVGALPAINGISGNPVSNGEMTEETFLRLLTTQLQHQDPLEPASDVEFIEQMATFASLEQQRLTNSNLSVIQLYQSSLNNSNALNIVGKDVKLQDSYVEHAEGQNHTIFYESDSEAAKVHITVVDEDGKEVFTQTQLGGEDGEQEFIWHGRNNDGETVPAGQYRVKVLLENDEGTKFPTTVMQMDRVNGISYENGSIVLIMGDKRVPIESVVEVYEGSGADPEEESASNEPGFKNTAFFQPLQQQPFRVIAGGR